jgi:hypothetical protein
MCCGNSELIRVSAGKNVLILKKLENFPNYDVGACWMAIPYTWMYFVIQWLLVYVVFKNLLDTRVTSGFLPFAPGK